MISAGKTAIPGILFLLLFFFVFPLNAENKNDDAIINSEEPAPAGETVSGEESFPGEEIIPDKEIPPGEENAPGEEIPPGEETASGEENTPGEESSPGEKSLSGEESPPGEEPGCDEDNFLNDDDFFLLFDAAPIIIEARPVYESRSFDDIFPGFTQRQKTALMSRSGTRNFYNRDETPILIPNAASGIDLLSNEKLKNSTRIVEALALIPYSERELDMLDIYNALGRVEHLKDQKIPLNNGQYRDIFTETTRLESAQNKKPVPDPLPANMLPYSETMYLRFKDPYIGDINIRGDIVMSLYGITYNLTNFTDVRFSFIRLMRSESASINIYLEPVKEGVLIYSISGYYLPDFIAKRINLDPSINNRITALINWIGEGLRIQENAGQKNRE